MEVIFAYIKPIVFFLILESVVFSLMSDGAFKKLAKLFCGIVLVILILVPAGKVLGITENPGDFLKNAQLEQSMRQCEDMINHGDEYLVNRYSEEYEKIIKENIKEIVANEGMELTDCDVSMDTDGEVKIKRIALSVSERGQPQEDIIDIHTDISISLNDEKIQISEEPEIIKIRNKIMDSYHIEEGDILITKS